MMPLQPDGERCHHPIFSCFIRPEIFVKDSFLGTVSRREFTSEAMQELFTARGPSGLPAFNEEYFEWIDLLESIRGWKPGSGPYTFMELGAGYGRWSVRAAFARPMARIIAVEAEPTHFAWMKQNFADNGLSSDRHKLIEAAVSDTPGEINFLVGKAAEWYGQCISEAGTATVKVVTLESLIQYECVDLIDMDIQGAEYVVIRAGLEKLNANVKRLHIATHSHEIEGQLLDILYQNGWDSIWDFPGAMTHDTAFGSIEFQDGVQSWVNKRLL